MGAAFQRYGIEGFKKTFLTHTKSINQIVLGLTLQPGTPEETLLFTTDRATAKEKQAPLLKSVPKKHSLHRANCGDRAAERQIQRNREMASSSCCVSFVAQRLPHLWPSTSPVLVVEMTYGLRRRSWQLPCQISSDKTRREYAHA